MYPRSSKFDEHYIRSHKMVSTCKLYTRSGEFIQELYITDGNITVDDAQANRRTAKITLTDPEHVLVPAQLGDMLAPLENIVKLERGIVYPDGEAEILPVGSFIITDARLDDSGQGFHMQCDLADYAYEISLHTLINEMQVLTGTNYVTAIQQLTKFSTLNFSTSVQATTLTTPTLTYKIGTDPWKAATNLAESAGMELFFDPEGTLIIRSIPNYDLQPIDWTFAEGADATILYFNKRLTSDGFFNHVVVIGQASVGDPVRADAFDGNTGSPSSIYGKYGDIVKVITDDKIVYQATAQASANGALQKALGLGELTRFNALVHPCFEIGDIIYLRREASKLDSRYVVDKITIPMTPDRPMDISCGRRQV